MALNVVSPDFTGTLPAAQLTAPTTSEVVDVSGGDVFLLAVIGATATTITTSVGPTDAYGRAQSVLTTGSLTSTTRILRIARSQGNANGQVTVTFSQVASVTAVGIRP